jgi:stress responsive alpha/beta barrel protein
MFIHAVYFWLRPDLGKADRKKFEAGLESLRGIKGVEEGYIGSPASTNRPVIERGYTRSLVLVFRDEAAHDAYQTHSVHDRFREGCGGLWTTLRIYDSVTDESEADR